MIPNRNVAFIISLETLWALGSAFITFDILSALIYSLGGSAMLVAIISTLSCLLVYAPQLLVPYFQQRITHVIGGCALGQGFIVVAYSICAVALWLTQSKPVLRTLVAWVLCCAALGNAFCSPFYQQLRLRLFPARTRSASYSTALFASQIAAIVGAALAIPILTARDGPTQSNYLWCFFVAVAFCTLATACFAGMRDPDPTPRQQGEIRPLSAFLRDFVSIFRSDRNLRVFLLSEWMNWLSAMGSTFIAFYAVGLLGESIAPECSFARCVGAIATVPLAHLVMTRLGPRSLIISFYLLAIAMYALLVVSPSRVVILFATVLLGGVGIFRINYMFHFIAALCPDADKTRYYALCAAVVAPATLIGPCLGGLLIKWFANYQLLFALSIVPLVTGLWLVCKILKDPITTVEDVGPVSRVSLKRMTP